MNNFKNYRKMVPAFAWFLLMTIGTPGLLFSQAYSSKGATKLVVGGTSNIHDWTLTSNSGTCNATVAFDGSGNLTGINNLSFTMAVTSLKSEHGSTMDNNAYKAMASDKYPSISFSAGSCTIKSNGGGQYSISAPGKLSISSGKRDVTLVASAKVNPDKSISLSGAYTMVTTDFNVKPISIMLGTIKTSPTVKINYTLVMKP